MAALRSTSGEGIPTLISDLRSAGSSIQLRWLAEDGSFYQTELGEEGARRLYEESHAVYHKLGQVLGKEAYSALREAVL